MKFFNRILHLFLVSIFSLIVILGGCDRAQPNNQAQQQSAQQGTSPDDSVNSPPKPASPSSQPDVTRPSDTLLKPSISMAPTKIAPPAPSPITPQPSTSQSSQPITTRPAPAKPSPLSETELETARRADSYNDICRLIVDDKSRSYPTFQRTELKERMLAAHNQDRGRFGLSALSWAEELASYAQRWAEYLRDNSGCEMLHRSNVNMREGKIYGENLAYFWTSRTLSNDSFTSQPEQAVAIWNGECEDYDLANNICVTNKQCGHFTQVVWQDTERVGCGVAFCNAGDANYSRGGRAEIWVCNYDPPGNFIDNTTHKVKRPFAMMSMNPTKPEQPHPNLQPIATTSSNGSTRSKDTLSSSTTPSHLVLFGTEQCGLCKAAKQLLDDNNIAYVFNDLNKDQSFFSQLPQEVYANRFPYVFFDGKYKGGLEKLREMVNAGDLPKKE